jgi:hypothetical protein
MSVEDSRPLLSYRASPADRIDDGPLTEKAPNRGLNRPPWRARRWPRKFSITAVRKYHSDFRKASRKAARRESGDPHKLL